MPSSSEIIFIDGCWLNPDQLTTSHEAGGYRMQAIEKKN